MRVGEITGLRWCDIDFEEEIISVNHTGNVQHQGTLNKALRRIIRDCNYEVLDKVMAQMR